MSVADILVEIAARRRERLGGESPPEPDSAPGQRLGRDHPFLAELERLAGRAVIAEVKMGSPRIGSLRGRVDPVAQARLYAEHGAAAVSVVVEPDFFDGSYELLARCREEAGLPVLAKDFVVHPKQMDWAREAGADAVLLIAALYGREELFAWASCARQRNLVPLIEIHDAEDVSKLAGRDWELVGVNNRNLRTFVVDLDRSIDLVECLPPGAVKVAESGIAARADLERLRGSGFDAFLIGESLLLAADPAAKLRELVI
jgi:indole-3-glycerol phosphate synthase